MVLKHRHIGEGMGISISMAVQAYNAQTGGMPKALREISSAPSHSRC